jgi:hypothetical protein
VTESLIYYIGNAGPTISMRLSSLVGNYDFVAGQQVKIRARPEWSSTTGLDVDATVDVAADTVSYTPQPGDFTQVGPYKVWAHIVDINQDSTEVDLMVFEHAPGEGQRVGAISFWTDQVVQQSARGNSEEVVTYPDRVKAAQEAIDRYRKDLENQLSEDAGVLGPTSSAYAAPALLDSGPLLTPGLDEYRPMPVSLPWYQRSSR